MEKYTLYSWHADNEGGMSMCLTEDWSPSLQYYPQSGWRAHPSIKEGEFNDAAELARLLMSIEKQSNDNYIARAKANTNPFYIYAPIDSLIYHNHQYHLQDAQEMMEWFETEREEY